MQQYQNMNHHNANLQNDLSHLGNILTNLKIENQQLLEQNNQYNQHQ